MNNILLDEIFKNKDEILDIFEKYGAENVKLIGSVSRREEKTNSDIDFVAKLKCNGILTDLQAHTDLIKELSLFFDRKVEVAPYEQIQEQYPRALKLGVELKR
ncbi:nucleotidyltransferase domain-containing protein [Priestia filamentosa]|uniref:nucleotidyltransferase family protein n=1 Tax=Priestia filamentosa TaxID=1402861 RepID=UPI002E1D2C73|nr:nucleotidyltransferase domain-containing protein [Priestia filamentosa]